MEITNSESWFQPTRFIAVGMADINRRILAAGYFQGTGPDEFAEGAGSVLGDVHHVHPFREGNGRTQFRYLRQLAWPAGHAIDLTSKLAKPTCPFSTAAAGCSSTRRESRPA